jgi:cellulose biosynthesis protein BcsQ
LPLGQPARDQLNGINAEDRYILLIISVEMGDVMGLAQFYEHPDDNPEETAELRHKNILPRIMARYNSVEESVYREKKRRNGEKRSEEAE